MDVRILNLVEGAKQADGIAVIIDVFRAFTLEPYLYDHGAKEILATGSEQAARAYKREHPDCILIGERSGKILPGFDYGNSPYAVSDVDFTGKTVMHTTSNGTQGIDNACNAEEVLVASFVNAKATCDYIRKKEPSTVSLVAMGWLGKITEEDVLCAQYMKSLLLNDEMKDIDEALLNLKEQEGKKFFDPSQSDVFPEGDFWMCIKKNIFNFAIRCEKDGELTHNRRIDIYG